MVYYYHVRGISCVYARLFDPHAEIFHVDE